MMNGMPNRVQAESQWHGVIDPGRWATKAIVSMKTQIIIWSVVLNCMSADVFSDDSSRGGGSFQFIHMPVSKVLDIYVKFSGKELVISTGALETDTTLSAQGVAGTKEKAAQLIVRILRMNAGVILTPIEGGRVSVTYNNKLDRKDAEGPKLRNTPSITRKPLPKPRRFY